MSYRPNSASIRGRVVSFSEVDHPKQTAYTTSRHGLQTKLQASHCLILQILMEVSRWLIQRLTVGNVSNGRSMSP